MKKIKIKSQIDIKSMLKFINSKISNYPELTIALKHYPKNSEKYEAMVYCIKETLMRYFVPDESTDLFNSNMILDAKQISAKYLIENVELAFLAKNRFSWAKRLYDTNKLDFFMRVLPYRIGSSKLIQLGSIERHWRALFLDKDVYNSIKEQLNLATDFNTLQKAIDNFSKQYEKAKTPQERSAILQDVVAFLDIDIYYNAEGVRYFPRGMGEQTLYNILTLGQKDASVQSRGGRCTDLDSLLRHTLMSFGFPVTSMRFPEWARGNDNHETLCFEWEGERFILSPCTHATRDQNYMKEVYTGVGSALREDWGQWEGSSKIVLDTKEKMPFTIYFYRKTRSVFQKTEFFDKTRPIDLTKHVKKQPKGTFVYIGTINNSWLILDKNSNPINIAAVEVTKATDKIYFDVVDEANILYFPHIYYEKFAQKFAIVIGKPFALMGDKTIFFKEETKSGDMSVNITSTVDATSPTTEYTLFTFKGETWIKKLVFTTDNKGNATLHGINKDVVYIIAPQSMQFLRPWAVDQDGNRTLY